MINSQDLRLEFETFLCARVRRYTKKNKSYGPAKFLKKMMTTSIHYMENDMMLFDHDINAKRICIEYI